MVIDPGLQAQTRDIGKSVDKEIATGVGDLQQSKAALEKGISDIQGQAFGLGGNLWGDQVKELQRQLDAVNAAIERTAQQAAVDAGQIPHGAAGALADGQREVSAAAQTMVDGVVPVLKGMTGTAVKAGYDTVDAYAQGVLARQNKAVDAMNTLRNLMKNSMGRMTRIGRDIGYLTSEALARALNDPRGSVRKAAQETRDAWMAELQMMIERGGKVGDKAMVELKKAMHSKNPDIRHAAQQVYNIISGKLDMGDDAYKWGKAIGNNFANGLSGTTTRAVHAALLVSGKVRDILRTGSPSKEGPFSEGGGPEGWGKRWADLYVSGMRGGLSGIGDVLGNMGAPAMAAAGGGGGSLVVNINGVSVMTPGSAEALAQHLGPVVTRWQQRSGMLPRVAGR